MKIQAPRLVLLWLVASAGSSSVVAFAPMGAALARSNVALRQSTVAVSPEVEAPVKDAPVEKAPVKKAPITPKRVPYKKPAPRVLKSVNPLLASGVEREYLTGVNAFLNRYVFFNTVAFTSVSKLGAPESFLDRLESGAQYGSRFVRILSGMYGQPNRRVNEQAKTVSVDDATGKATMNREVLLQSACERAAYTILEDLNNVRNGVYPLPSELKPSKILSPGALPTFAKDLTEGLQFALSEQSYSGGLEEYNGQEKMRSSYLEELASGLDLPEYYMTDFHSVPGGFLSPEHVKIYDLLSETVFLGTHYMARRMMFPPLARAIETLGGRQQDLKLLDIGTGTGTFLLQIQEALPKLQLSGLDLSPAMLEHAQGELRAKGATAKLMQGNMEAMPVGDRSFDLITQSNCFHEMPEHAIRNTAKQVARVLKQGGYFFHHDASQVRDDPPVAKSARVTFDNHFNEPYMYDWLYNVDLDEIFAAEGLVPVEEAKPYFASTVRVYRKQ